MADTYRLRTLLRGYFKMVFEAAGLKWGSDNETEMNELAAEIKALIRSVIAEEFEANR